MTNKQLSIVVLVVVLLVLVVGGVVYFRNTTPTDDVVPVEDLVDSGVDAQHLVITHAFDGAEHEFTGSIILPTPCYALETSVVVAESFPEQITINLSTMAPEEEEVCAQVLERATFDVLVTASEGAKLMRVVLDGVPVDFEIFEEFKG